ncbi:MAG: dihydroorotate dehydrogenase electron transfer subunit, partial [bacterium]
PGFFRLICRVPATFADPVPGQFVQLRLNERSDPLLPRPYGIVDFRRESDHAIFELYYGVVGAGTRILARFRPSDSIPCIGPLGRGYRFDADRDAVLVAGGRGVAPLLMLYAALRPMGRPIPFERIAESDRLIATDDGTLGVRGNALDLLSALPEALLASATIYACGPEILLEKTALFALERGIPCQVSLEAPFACGVGICRGCAVPAAAHSGYLMCCSDGPVFSADEIRWGSMP